MTFYWFIGSMSFLLGVFYDDNRLMLMGGMWLIISVLTEIRNKIK